MNKTVVQVLDLGTTTLSFTKVNTDTGETTEPKIVANEQFRYGADVISRIEYCKKYSIKAPHETIINQINSFLSDDCDTLYVSGNTAMLHILSGKNPKDMATAPYTPVFLEGQKLNGKDIGLNIKNVVTLPCIHSFVGADLVAGLNQLPKPQDGKYSLLADLGTNAEILLFNKNEVLCTSAAAGPCFEGANISCGMSATDGAICSFFENGTFEVIGNTKPLGICGSGIIDVIAVLIDDGTISDDGNIGTKSFAIGNNISLTQTDIRQYQVAKSAVYSAIIALLKEKNIGFNDIEKLYIAGGFSEKINIANTVKTGLFPLELAQKCTATGNTSLSGTIDYAMGKKEFAKIIDNAQYLNLAENEMFKKLFIENMNFSEN